jgi:hypothetical protein
MQEHALVTVVDAEEFAHVGRRDTLDVTQHNDLALALRELWKQLLNALRHAFGHQPVVRPVGPRLGWHDPRPGGVEAPLDLLVGAPGPRLLADR